jgi:hypothetical protein
MADNTNNPQTPAVSTPKAAAGSAIPATVTADSASEADDSVKKLSKEEQMAAFEEDLKNNDWGHQPC